MEGEAGHVQEPTLAVLIRVARQLFAVFAVDVQVGTVASAARVNQMHVQGQHHAGRIRVVQRRITAAIATALDQVHVRMGAVGIVVLRHRHVHHQRLLMAR